VLSIGSTSNFNISLVLAERQVQADLAKIQQSSAQLRRDQAQLDIDQRNLNAIQQQTQKAVKEEIRQARQAGMEVLREKAPAEQASASTPAVEATQDASQTAPQPQVNAEGQTIGQLIDVVA